MKTIALCVLSATLLCGCVTNLTTGTPQISRETVDKALVKGKTTKAQVRALFGEPQTISSSSMSTTIPGLPSETWVYTKTMRYDTMRKGPLYSFGMFALTNSIYDRTEFSMLMIMFDRNGRLLGHTFSSSAAGMSR
jgi:hypothetical protein